jgi:hypothetical protein
MSHEEKGNYSFSNEFSKGREILQTSKAAIVLVTNDSDSYVMDAELQRLLNSFSEFMKVRIFHGWPLSLLFCLLELNILAPMNHTFP